MKILKYLFLLFLFVSGSSFALPKAPFYGKISTNISGSPVDSFLGKTLKLESKYEGVEQKDIIELNVSTEKRYVMKRDDVEITVFKDTNNLNRIRLFSKYDLFLKGKNEVDRGYFYALCPVVETTKKDLSEVEEVKNIDGKKISIFKLRDQTLSEKILDPGFFTVAHKSNERHTILTKQQSETFLEAQVELLCKRAEVTILRHQLDEINRKKALEWIEDQK